MKTSQRSARISMSMNTQTEFKPDAKRTGLSLTGTHLQQPSSIPDPSDGGFATASSFGKIGGRLPKLYTPGLYNNYSNKLLTVKQKFSDIHQQLQKGVVETLEEMPLRDLVKKADEVISKTYSIKYFGINNDQIGILSQRVPIKVPDNAKHFVLNARRTEDRDLMSKQQYSPKYAGTVSSGNRNTYNNGNSATDPIADLQSGHMNAYLPQPENYNVFVVNNYFIPKQLHSVRNKNKRSINFDQLEELIDQQLRTKSQKTPIQEKIPANYDRLTAGLVKVKRTMLRAPKSTFRFEKVLPQENIMEPTKSSTHEMKLLLAEKNSLSYAKLLNSLDNSEAADKIKNQSLPEEFLLGQEKRSRRASRTSLYIDLGVVENLDDTHRNVQIKVENGSSLYQNYAKIASKYTDERRLSQN